MLGSVWLGDFILGPIWHLVRHVILTPGFFVAVGFTLTLERVFPANPWQRSFGFGFAQDFVWFFYESALQAIVIGTYVHALRGIYHEHFAFLTYHGAQHWPFATRLVVGVLLLDFLYWLQHWLNHKVPMLWSFHALHHSQKELNFFTDYRYHVVEYIVRHTIVVIPFLILDVNTPTVVWIAVFQSWFTRFYHGNIRTNLGPLRCLLVTPQSHRVHHSIHARHRDQNFGSLFCIWDRLLGTQYHGDDEYPETGIDDDRLPHEDSSTIGTLVLMPLRQLAYPFRSLAGEEPQAAKSS